VAPRSRCTKGATFAPPLLRQIARDIGVTVEEFVTER
jgi:hypothetical protein